MHINLGSGTKCILTHLTDYNKLTFQIYVIRIYIPVESKQFVTKGLQQFL